MKGNVELPKNIVLESQFRIRHKQGLYIFMKEEIHFFSLCFHLFTYLLFEQEGQGALNHSSEFCLKFTYYSQIWCGESGDHLFSVTSCLGKSRLGPPCIFQCKLTPCERLPASGSSDLNISLSQTYCPKVVLK